MMLNKSIHMHHQIHTIGSTKRKFIFHTWISYGSLYVWKIIFMKSLHKMDGLRCFEHTHKHIPHINFQIHDAIFFSLSWWNLIESRSKSLSIEKRYYSRGKNHIREVNRVFLFDVEKWNLCTRPLYFNTLLRIKWSHIYLHVCSQLCRLCLLLALFTSFE